MPDELQKPTGGSSPPEVLVPEVVGPATERRPPFTEAHQLPHGLSRRQMVVAFAVAGLSDFISAFTAFAPPLEWAVDLATASVLFVVLGWRWLLLPGLIMEAIPGFGAFPFWVLVVSAIAVLGQVKPKLN
jgi:hypothetical protein